ncbi:hypothetical protein E8E12_005806 [Didymella heteroderae]|uniref:F-box domain-containing protein n=1 Tax=Didymella heteroderae TaxID=1769908 RepID=A0A9P4WL93_9PLEO|nr:hypothetical protein E8E12_005806 [Didymella heteroderae]
MHAESDICFLGELPDELLVAIASQLQVERGFLAEEEAEEARRCRNAVIVHSLHSLTLCCRRFNAVATPFLYQCIIRTEQLMTLLLPTLLQNPNLGRYIQYFEATTLSLYDRELYTPGFYRSFTKPVRDEFLERVKSAKWIIAHRNPVEGAALQPTRALDLTKISESTLQRIGNQISLSHNSSLVVFLSLTDNLQDVAIENNCRSNIIILALRQYTRPDAFRRLWLWSEDGTLSCGYMLQYICSDPKDPAGALPHYLRTLFLPDTMWSEFGPPLTLEELSYTMQDVSKGMIDEHLKGVSSLKAFSCRWQWTEKFSPRFPVNLPRIYKVLERFQSSLTRLTIDTTESAWRVDLDTFVPALGSLRDFKVLTYLDVSALVLWGDGDFWEPAPLSGLLPESVEHFVLKTEWDEDIEDQLYQLSSECIVSLPRLRKVECTWRPAPGFIADLLIDACHLAGVDLILDVEQPEPEP